MSTYLNEKNLHSHTSNFIKLWILTIDYHTNNRSRAWEITKFSKSSAFKLGKYAF